MTHFRTNKGIKMPKLLAVYLALLFISCTSDIGKTWNFKWTFLNIVDSSSISEVLQANIDIESERFNPTAENLEFSQKGILTFSIYIQGSESFVSEFPNNANINAKVFSNDSVCFDTLIMWNEMTFEKGEDADGNSKQDVNY